MIVNSTCATELESVVIDGCFDGSFRYPILDRVVVVKSVSVKKLFSHDGCGEEEKGEFHGECPCV